MIDPHCWLAPNGKKVAILLDECGLPYRIVPCNIYEGDQFKPESLALNPNLASRSLSAAILRVAARRLRSSNRA
jgi:glutathione S-transferase